ncbi:S8 family serine peptidase [Paenibacillus alkalitolerans]|uniref:S8 family serine peptidase n=1 Tax=Paenibacillus alkalitolerans TaxID=2799335 RepID=UPI0018F2EA66|nr:S8 family serine peptidase [Paenibacillus alkalitolerans]
MKKLISVLMVFAMILALVPAMSAGASDAQSFVVVFKKESLTKESYDLIKEAGGTVTYEVPEIGVLEAATTNPAAFIKSLLKNNSIQSLAPSFELPLSLPETAAETEQPAASLAPVPADQSIWGTGWQWDIEQVTNNGASHEISSGSKDVVVGIIDSGIDFNHPDLKNNIVPGSQTFVPETTDAFDYNSHGTHVAGTIAANGRLKGVAPEAGVRSYRVFGATGGAQQIWITKAIVAAANDGVDVINMSLGGTRIAGQWYYTDPETGETIRLGNDAADLVAYHRAVQYAVMNNVTVVATAGNDGQDLSNPAKLTDWYNAYLKANGLVDYNVQGAAFKVPGETPGIITVSATGGGFGTSDRIAFYSNYGQGAVDLSAPGGDLGPDYPNSVPADYYKYLILSTIPTYLRPSSTAKAVFGEGHYGWKGGTSMAAPQVSGAAAAYIARVYAATGKKPSPSQVQAQLKNTAVDAGKIGYDPLFGSGIVNAYKALTE